MTAAGPPRRPTRATTAGRAYLDLRNLARQQHRDTGELLHLYALEGFLARLTASEFAGRMVLKGGVLRPLAVELDGYDAIAQSRWLAWRRRQALEELLPSDFTVVLTSVIAFADSAIDGTAQNLTWSHELRAWRTRVP